VEYDVKPFAAQKQMQVPLVADPDVEEISLIGNRLEMTGGEIIKDRDLMTLLQELCGANGPDVTSAARN
jgi:hypothetical protein